MTWLSAGTDEPRDQQRDSIHPHYAEVGPEHPAGWSWTIVDSRDGSEVAGGAAATEAEAKSEVRKWEDESSSHHARGS